MSFYADYITEKTGKSILETEKGFATYSFSDNKTVYLEDIYIIPEARNSGEASRMADLVADIARERGCTTMLGSVIPTTHDATDSMHVLIHYGMKIVNSSMNFVLFSKEI